MIYHNLGTARNGSGVRETRFRPQGEHNEFAVLGTRGGLRTNQGFGVRGYLLAEGSSTFWDCKP